MILYVLLLFFGLDTWKPVRTEDLILLFLVFRLGYLETKDLICIVIVFRLGYLETHAN